MTLRSVFGSSTSLGALLDAKEQASMKIYDIPLPPGGFTRRVSYLSASIFSLADLIASLVNLIFSLLDAMVHLFQDAQQNLVCRHCFLYMNLSIATIYIGLVGFLMPTLADPLAGNFLKQIKERMPPESLLPMKRIRSVWNYLVPAYGPTLEEAFVEEQLDRIERSAEAVN